MKRSNTRIIGIEKRQVFQLKAPENIVNKMIEENLPNLSKVMPTPVQEAYRSPNSTTRKENPPCM
jgi:isocitrate dehydrogenase